MPGNARTTFQTSVSPLCCNVVRQHAPETPAYPIRPAIAAINRYLRLQGYSGLAIEVTKAPVL